MARSGGIIFVAPFLEDADDQLLSVSDVKSFHALLAKQRKRNISTNYFCPKSHKMPNMRLITRLNPSSAGT
jgi:hypothetical protein